MGTSQPVDKVRYGLKNLHLAFADGEGGFETPIAVPGAVGFTANPDGQDIKVYADDILYFVRTVNNGYTGEIENTLFPDAVIARMMGWKVDENGALIEIADGIPTPFALMAEEQTDIRQRRFVYYNCQASRPGQTSTTKGETIDPQTETMPLIIMPTVIGGENVVKSVLYSGQEGYDDFYTDVYEPDFDDEG